MPEYLDEPSQEESKFFETRQGETDTEAVTDAKTEPAEEQPKDEQEVEEKPGQKAVPADAGVDADADDPSDAKDVEQPKVNLGALHESRAQNKELRGELGQAKERMAAMEGRLSQILERIKTGPAEAAQEEKGPAYEDDPDGFYRHQIAELNRKMEGIVSSGKQAQEQGTQVQEQQQFVARYRAAAEEYGTRQKDFTQAYEWLNKNVESELQARGFTDPLQRQQIMAQEEAALVRLANRDNANPAERIYNLAKHRGYKAATDVEDKIVNLDKSTTKARSLGGVGGGTENVGTLEDLANKSGADFDVAWEKMRRAGKLG